MNIKKMLTIMAATATLHALAQAPVEVRWEMGQNGAAEGWYSSRFVIKNVSGKALDGHWALYFNQFSRKVQLPENCPIDLKEVSTTYYQITPGNTYRPLAAGDSLCIDVLFSGTFVNCCYSPMGFHFVRNGDTAHPEAVKATYSRLDGPKQWLVRNDYPSGDYMWAFNETLQSGKRVFHCYDIFPTPKSVKFTFNGDCDLGKGVNIVCANPKVRKFVTCELQKRGVEEKPQGGVKMDLQIKPFDENREAYLLDIDGNTLTAVGASAEGLMNSMKTLVAAIDHNKGLALPNAVINDAPDFNYRGVMLDIARNFTTFENLKRHINLLAYYKLNRFQFHFTDDEAWRVEIPGLPELTQVASRRGCTLDEKEYLAQIFDGNGNPDDLTQSANGYLTRQQMVELLQYADERGVTLIPEIETPGHARAAIVAMKARYNKYKDTDRAKAVEYKLWDDKDSSTFASAQDYRDNVLNLAQEGVYNFVLKVVTELQSMYHDAGLTLETVHLGGDEVPKGAWDQSPDVQAFMEAHGLNTAHQMSEYYIEHITDALYPRGIKVQGWQEVGLDHSDAFNAKMAPRFAGVNAWSTVGKRIAVPYTLANAGYPTLLSNVTNFYLDMAYGWHQYDKGLHWGGAVDEYASWSAQPLNIYRTARTDYNGNPIDLSHAADGMPALKKPENIVGIVGPLWTETIRDYDQVQLYMLPKVLGLVERAWNPAVEWNDDEQGSFEQARADYNNKIGMSELPLLAKQGYNFRLGQPGIKVEGGMLHANKQYPGEVVRYTLDGSEPDEHSTAWLEAVAIGQASVVKAKAFYLGKQSETTYLWLKP